jgi:hypothetical protein
MSEIIPFRVRLADGAIKDCTLTVQGGPPWTLILGGIELVPAEFVGPDLFEALCLLRHALEKIGAQALCAGARKDVYPSGMSRGMSGGRKAYVTKIGAPALRDDIVNIFDYAGPELVGSVEEQKAFHQEWAAYFRR